MYGHEVCERKLNTCLEMSMYIWVSSCSFNVYTGYSMNMRTKVRFFFLFFLVPDLEDQVLLKLKSSCFGVARLIPCGILGRKGQMLRRKERKEPGTLADREW